MICARWLPIALRRSAEPELGVGNEFIANGHDHIVYSATGGGDADSEDDAVEQGCQDSYGAEAGVLCVWRDS